MADVLEHPAAEPADLSRGLFVVACVALVGLAWLMPTQLLPKFAALQSLAGGVAVLLLIVTLWWFPGTVRAARLSSAEWSLALFIVWGATLTLLQPAALGRLAQSLWWLQAWLVIVTLARICDRHLLQKCLQGYALLAVAAAAAFIAHRAGFGSSRTPFIVHQNHLALLLILPTTFYLSRIVKPAALPSLLTDLAALLVLGGALLLSQSRAAWLGVAIAAGLTLVIDRRPTRWRLLPLLVVPTLLAAGLVGADRLWVAMGHDSLFSVLQTLLHPEEGSIGGRLRRWSNGLVLIREHWLFGAGLGNWATAYENVRHVAAADSGGNPSALNTYLQVLAETGIVGFAAFVAFVVAAFRQGLRRGVPGGVVGAAAGWLVALVFHSLYDFKILLLAFAFLFGMLLWPAAGSTLAAPRRWARLAPHATLALAVMVFLGDARYGIAELERVAVQEAATSTGQQSDRSRLLWTLLDPFSAVIDAPYDATSLLRDSPALVRANRLQPPDSQDLLLLLAERQRAAGDYDGAIAWYRRALVRNPVNVRALAGSCAVARLAGHDGEAREYCRRGVIANPAEPRFHELLAAMDRKEARPEAAAAHLARASELLLGRLDVNNFGIQTRFLVSNQYAAYQAVNADLARVRQSLFGDAVRPLEPLLTGIARSPSIHKSVSTIGCHLYLSANLNARFNLWRYDLCKGGELELMTNDSLAPFRLHAGGRRLYFMADDRGDNRFDLYRLDPASVTIEPVPRPRGLLLEYRPSPDGRRLAVVVHRGGAFRLFAGDLGDAGFVEVMTSRTPLSEPVWRDGSETFVVIDGGRRLIEVNATAPRGTRVLAAAPGMESVAFAPDGRRAAVTLHTGARRGAIALLEADGSLRNLLDSGSSYYVDPLWRDAATLAFREVANDEYLLREIDVGGAGPALPRAIGPVAGVVYGVEAHRGDLLFVAASEYHPASVFRLPAAADQAQEVMRFDWIAPSSVVPSRRLVLDAQQDVVAYRYAARSTGRSVDAALVWLHGGSNRFSPRWHSYAQYFAHSGFEFVALNYPEQWPQGNGDRAAQARSVEDLVKALRAEGFGRVFLIGVSTGTQVIQEYLSGGFAAVDGVVEYSPVNNDHWRQTRRLPPLLGFTGRNDPLLDHPRRRADIARHRDAGSSIQWVEYVGEGHDLRARGVIEERMRRTRRFLLGLAGGGTVAEAHVAEVPGLDHDPGLRRSGDGAVVVAE